MRRSENIKDKLIPIVTMLIILVIWQMVVAIGLIERYVLPAPLDVLKAFINMFPEVNQHLIVTLYEASVGFGIAVVFSVVLAVLMDSVPLIKKAVGPLLVVSQTVPIIILAPLFAMWFGFGVLPKIIVVVLVCFFPIVISLLDGFQSVNVEQVNMMKIFGGGWFQTFKMVKFPVALGSFFSGLRIAATYSIMGAVIGEWLGGKHGIGVYMMRLKHSFKLDEVFAVILLIILLSLGVFYFITLLRTICMPWERAGRSDKKQGGV